MPTEAKRAAVAELREQLAGSRTLIVSEYRGLTVREIGEIRRSLRKQDVSYRVVKNRLMKIAASGRRSIGARQPARRADGDRVRPGRGRHGEGRDRHHATRTSRSASPARSSAIARSTPMASVRLAALPPRDVLLAQIAGAFAAPMATTAGLFDAPLRDVVGLVAALADSAPQPDPRPRHPTHPTTGDHDPWPR